LHQTATGGADRLGSVPKKTRTPAMNEKSCPSRERPNASSDWPPKAASAKIDAAVLVVKFVRYSAPPTSWFRPPL
jgi:hypothetical protein